MARRPTRRGSARQGRKKSSRSARAPQGWIWGLVLLAVALITLLSLLSANRGQLTSLWLYWLRRAFGWGIYVVPAALAVLGVWLITLGTERPLRPPWARLVGLAVLLLVGLTLSQQLAEPAGAEDQPYVGGQVGELLSRWLTAAFGRAGAVVILIVAAGAGVVMAFQVSLAQIGAGFVAILYGLATWLRVSLASWSLRRAQRAHAGGAPVPLYEEPPMRPATSPPTGYPALRTAQPVPTFSPIPAATINLRPPLAGEREQWTLPSISDMLAESNETQMSLSDIRDKTRTIEETLTSLGVPAKVVEVNPGPVVTQFGVEPGYLERHERDGEVKRAKVKVSRIAALANDLALALAASPIRIEAPVPGKGIVGIEIPNSESAVVGLRGVMESEQFRALSSRLALAVGRDVSGMAVVDDLAKLPHLLIAGATGSGKSVCINAFVACLLFRNTPDDLRMLMIDPKRVELSGYNGIPHLLAPVVVDAERVVGVLGWVSREMDRRYKVFARVGARNLGAYNQLAAASGQARMPLIVVFIDELADLMMVAPDEVERSICRIAQMARATGIHLVVATQRPSVDVITGLIKANFPARLAFAVTSQIDSRVVLDVPGADKLLGRGDALYMAPDSPKLMRIQGCWVSDVELGKLVAFWKGQAGVPADQGPAGMPTEALIQQPLPGMPAPGVAEGRSAEEEGADPLLTDAIALVKAEGRASVSFLQRRLRIGYTRAARLVDLLEERGIIGPATGTSKMREVLGEESAVNGDDGAPPSQTV